MAHAASVLQGSAASAATGSEAGRLSSCNTYAVPVLQPQQSLQALGDGMYYDVPVLQDEVVGGAQAAEQKQRKARKACSDAASPLDA
jgi:hypothetical protein